MPLYDYAVGGATTSNSLIQGFTGPSSTIPVPAVTDQVAAFLSGTSPQGSSPISSSSSSFASGEDLSRPLFVVWAGANDIFFNPNISAAQTYLEITSVVSALLDAHPASRVLTVASPDLARLPYAFYADELTKSQLRSFTDLLAALLLAEADGPRRPRGNVNHVDLRGLFDAFEYFAAPESYGFAPLGKYGSCLVGVYGEGAAGANGTISQCLDVGGRVYWDEYQ